MHALLKSLAGGNRRSIGQANRVVATVIDHPALMRTLFDGMASVDPALGMRCADVLEKVTAQRPEWLRPYKKLLLHRLAKIEQPDVRWHVAPMLARLPLTDSEEDEVLGLLFGYTHDRSSIVRTMAMQALADIALRSPRHLPAVRRHIEALTAIGTPAMKARGKKLLHSLIGDRPPAFFA